MPTKGKWLVDLGVLLTLLFFASALRAWQLQHTEVAARDSIGFIRYAWQLQHRPWPDVIRKAEQHPGYPLTVLAMSYPVRQFFPASDALVMQTSAQLATALAGVLLVIPLFYLGKELFNQAAGFWGALLFQCLPTSSRVLADGLSEGVFFLWAATGLLLALQALRGNSWLLFCLTGLFGGLAYLTRPEGALIVAATGIVLLAMQRARTRRQWRPFLFCGVSLILGWAVVGVPYIAISGKLTNKPTGLKLLTQPGASDPDRAPVTGTDTRSAPLLAAWWSGPATGTELWSRMGQVCMEVVKAFHYTLWLPALAGLWWFRDRFRREPGSWVLLLVGIGVLLLLWRVAYRFGYVSDRHTLLIVLCGCPWAAAAILKVGRWLEQQPFLRRVGAESPWMQRRVLWSGVLFLGVIASALPKTLEPLHANRSGFREAGVWLAEHTWPGDEVKDPYCWTHYYAGRVFTEGEETSLPPGHQPTCYVVLEEGSSSEHLRLPDVPVAKSLAHQGTKVFEWSGRRKNEVCLVRVFAVPVQP
jgi:hypothetical protein